MELCFNRQSDWLPDTAPGGHPVQEVTREYLHKAESRGIEGGVACFVAAVYQPYCAHMGLPVQGVPETGGHGDFLQVPISCPKFFSACAGGDTQSCTQQGSVYLPIACQRVHVPLPCAIHAHSHVC